MKLRINNIDFTKDADLSNIQVTAGLNSDNTIDVVSTNTIKVSGEAAKYLDNVFFSNPCEGKKKSVDVSIYDDCCNVNLEFKATAQGTKKCGCEIEFVLRGKDKANCYEKLKQKVFWENGFKTAYKHPQIYYVNRPTGAIVIFFLSLVISFIIRLIFEICQVIDRIINFVTFGGSGVDCSPLEDFLCDFSEYVTGNNWKSPAPYIRNILEFNAKLCGLTLQSSIFQNSIYKDAVLFQNQYTRGLKNARQWIDDNGANLTVLQLLDKLKPVFNLDYRIQGDKLIVERKDYFDTPSKGVIYDIRQEDYCLSIDTSTSYANANYKYQDDAIDTESNRTIREYDDRVEWNVESSEWKKGTLEVQNDFGRARFMFDSNSLEKDGFFDFDATYDVLSKTGIPAIQGLCNNTFTRRNNDLVMSNHTTQYLKILVLEPNTNLDDAQVIKRKTSTRPLSFLGIKIGNVQFYDYNYPMWYAESETNGLYQNFHFIDNPNLNYAKIVEIEDVEMEYDCDTINKIISDPTSYGVLTNEGVAIPSTWIFDLNAKTVKMTGIKVKCK